MNQIKCPHCEKLFTVDETGYADIVKQIRNEEFAKDLEERLAMANLEKNSAIELAEAKKDAEIMKLRASLETTEVTKKLAISEAINELKNNYESTLKIREQEIASIKEYRSRQTNKIIGESLEQHCEMEFNRVRALGFSDAYFEKDNTVQENGKGDYIFRDFSSDGTEYISIMFDMKNEADTTVTKKKNVDFLEKLDKDRNAKGCEFAVLVSTLEADNELYNSGIVDVSHRYPNMFIVRPNCFISIITLLRNASRNVITYKSELARVKEQNIDITTFEDELAATKKGFKRNWDLASEKFDEAILDIDKAIERLQKTKDSLLGSNNNLRLANSKLEDITIKKLTRNNPRVAQMFNEVTRKSIEN
jgi:hypothetical protein